MKAWHFTSDQLHDGRPIPPVGETLRHDGSLMMCESGFHASLRLIDSLMYAPGSILHRVEIGDDYESQGHNDKVVSYERTILWSFDATDVLRSFARLCALDVIHLWDAPAVVRRYLETGDESLRAAVQAIAWDAVHVAARVAAWAAAEDAFEYAAHAVARDGARAAAHAAAWAVARDGAHAAARDAARDGVRAAAWDGARAAIRAAADAAWVATRDGAREKQNKRLTTMVLDAAEKVE